MKKLVTIMAVMFLAIQTFPVSEVMARDRGVRVGVNNRAAATARATAINNVNVQPAPVIVRGGGYHRGGRGGNGFWPAFGGAALGTLAGNVVGSVLNNGNGYQQAVYPQQVYQQPVAYPVQYTNGQPQPRGWVKEEVRWVERIFDPYSGTYKLIQRKVERLTPVY